jgi:hypothetical protein
MNICHNPACHRPIRHADAYLRSVSLVQVAFCSAACVAMFGQLDAASRRPVPEQRRPVGRVR